MRTMHEPQLSHDAFDRLYYISPHPKLAHHYFLTPSHALIYAVVGFFYLIGTIWILMFKLYSFHLFNLLTFTLSQIQLFSQKISAFPSFFLNR